MPKRKGPALDPDNSFRCSECNKTFEGRRALRIHASVCLPRSAALAAAPFQPSVVFSSDLPSEGLSPSQPPGRNTNFPDPRSHSEEPLEADTNQDSPYRGGHELNEAARFEPVSGSQLPRSNTLAFRRQPEQQKHTLPCSALKLLPLLCEKSAVFSDKLLKVIKDKTLLLTTYLGTLLMSCMPFWTRNRSALSSRLCNIALACVCFLNASAATQM